MNGLTQAAVLGQARTLLAAVLPIAVSFGWLPANQVTLATSVILVFVAAGFSLYDKFAVKKQIAVAHATPADVPLPK